MDSRTTVKPKNLQVLDLTEQAASICETALNQARLQLPRTYDEKELADLLIDPLYIAGFKNVLAELVADELVNNDSAVEAVHQFNPDANPGLEDSPPAPIDLSLHLICVVEKSSAALSALVSGLDRGITSTVKSLPVPWYNQLETVLDVVFVAKKDIEQRRGYAALLTSFHAPPLRIWPS